MSKKSGIEVYLRVRPTKKPFTGLGLQPDEGKIEFNFQRDGLRTNEIKDDYYQFKYNGIFDMLTQQESVFEQVAKDVVDDCIQGYNGTIFAYGQTGSGKTFTITGGAERYADRGIIPRTLSYIFGIAAKDTSSKFKISISYLEIYNEAGYDLLDENHASKNLFDLPKVQMYEDKEGHFKLTNLSVHRAQTEEDALNLLFIGDTNRVVSETPKNDASTRSHCIFVIQLEIQKLGSDVKRVSKLHLVDLSGSERVFKSGVEDEKTIKESKYINQSLFMLQMVIMNLNKKAKGEDVHIPFRNSMMTMILRDSLGGNCRTKMIATISALKDDMGESLGTCRFARSVQMIQNDMKRNETVDPGVIIGRLKQEVRDLKAEIALLKGGQQKDHLTTEDIDRCNRMVQDFIKTTDPEQTLILPDRLMINQCFYQFRQLLKNAERGVKSVMPDDSQQKAGGGAVAQSPASKQENDAEVQRLNMLVKQRDNEIAILVNYLNKKKSGEGDGPGVPVQRAIDTTQESLNATQTSPYQQEERKENAPTLYQMMTKNSPRGKTDKSAADKRRDFELAQDTIKRENGIGEMISSQQQYSLEDLADRAKAFEHFRKSYRKNEAMEDNRNLLKEKYARGKNLGTMVNETRNMIKEYTNQIEAIRKQNALRGLVDENGEIIRTQEETILQNKIAAKKIEYQTDYNELKDLKTEIEQIQNLLERSRVAMQKDFEQWLSLTISKARGN